MTLMHHQHIISASSVHHQCIISASSVHHQCILGASSAHHQRIISTSSAHHQCIISASPDQDREDFNLADLILELAFQFKEIRVAFVSTLDKIEETLASILRTGPCCKRKLTLNCGSGMGSGLERVVGSREQPRRRRIKTGNMLNLNKCEFSANCVTNCTYRLQAHLKSNINHWLKYPPPSIFIPSQDQLIVI